MRRQIDRRCGRWRRGDRHGSTSTSAKASSIPFGVNMKRRVAIIGTGWVGSSVAISTLHSGVADELLLHDAREAVAEGEAMDLAHGASFYPPAVVRTATIDEMVDADVVVIAAGRGGRPGESRLDLLRENAALIGDIGKRLTGARGTILVVSNPVDVLTQRMTEVSGLPAARVVGTGTMLDTARLKQVIGRVIHVDPHSFTRMWSVSMAIRKSFYGRPRASAVFG